MRYSRWASVFVVSLVLLLGLLVPAMAQVRGGTLVIAYQSNTVPEPDPQVTRNIGAQWVAEMIADPLLRYDNATESFVPVLATSWDISEDGLHYTFHLREGVLFHNGVTLTAEAVAKSYERIRDAANPLAGAGLLSPVDTIEVLDPLTIRLNMKSVFPDFLSNMDRLWILEPGSFTNPPAGSYVVGCGPFRIVPAEYKIDQSMVLEKFAQYWAGEPYLDKIQIRIIPDMATALIELEQGTVDVVQYGSGKDLPRLEALGMQPIIFGRVNWANVVINLSHVTDVRLRKAIMYAVDQQALIDGAYGGLGDPMYRMGYPGTWLENTKVGAAYDPEEAKRILDEAGWKDTNKDGIREIDGKEIDLYFPTRNQAEWVAATQMIQQMLREVGIGTHITMAERMPFYDQVRTGDYDIAWWLSNDSAEPPIALYTWDMREYWCVHQAKTPVLQLLIEQAESELDRDTRSAYYQEIQRILIEEAYAAPGMWNKQVHVMGPKAHGMLVASTGIAYNSHLWWKG